MYLMPSRTDTKVWRCLRSIHNCYVLPIFRFLRARLLLRTISSRAARSYPTIITIFAIIDRASQVLAQGLHLDVPRTYAALAEQGDVRSLYFTIVITDDARERN